ncbi:MAG TPA: hypothetical protein VFO85_16595 [Vicinamibacteria bacterium]|nr:hypothetical protein [Vicinamibacteria bacterium]
MLKPTRNPHMGKLIDVTVPPGSRVPTAPGHPSSRVGGAPAHLAREAS